MSTYVHYGNPLKELEEEEAPKRFKDETARDEKGRRRFHGAFTGGFSAGYFNTVDTKEGWAPAQFKSSRSDRAAGSSQQTPHDFMDQEDLGELGIAPQRLQVQEGVRSSGKAEGTQKSGAGVGSQRELLTGPLKNILKDDSGSIGMQILRGMGWRDGKGIGPKHMLKDNFGPQLPGNVEIAPDDIEVAEIKGTDKTWGLGYSPIDRLDLFGDRIDRDRVTQTTANIRGKRLGIRGQAFGVGAFEDDDEDIYARDDLKQYAFEEVDHRATEKKKPKNAIEAKKKSEPNGLIDGFVSMSFSSSVSRMGNSYSFSIPKDWTPTPMSVVAEKSQKELTRQEKIASLAEKPYTGSVFDLLSDEARERIESVKRAAQDARDGVIRGEPDEAEEESIPVDSDKPLAQLSVECLKPFAHNPKKQERFERFVHFAEIGHREMLSSIQPTHFTAWETTLEQKEFNAALLIVRPKLGLSNRFESKAEAKEKVTLPSGFTQLKDLPKEQVDELESQSKGPPIRPIGEFGDKTHNTVEWHPKSLLCKRFNVPDPFPGNETVGIPTSALKRFNEASGDYVAPSEPEPQAQSSYPAMMPKSDDLVKTVADTPGRKPEPEFLLEEEAEPPPIDIFKSIFSDDDDDEPEPQDSKDAAQGKKNAGIFAGLDLSALNQRPVPKPIAPLDEPSAESTLPPMGPKPPPIIAVERYVVTNACKKSKKAKKEKKNSKRKSKKHKKSSNPESSAEESSQSESEEEEAVKKRKKHQKDKSKSSKKHKRKSKKSRKGPSDGSPTSSADSSDDEERINEKLREKLSRMH